MTERRKRLLPIVGIVLAAATTGGILLRRHQLAQAPLELYGTIEARTIQIGSRVGGRVREVLVKEGDAVTASQPLVILEVGDLAGQKLQAQGQLEQAEASLSKVTDREGGARRQEIVAARAHLASQEIAVEKARLDLGRVKRLFAGGATTRTELDNAEVGLRNAVAQQEAIQAQLDEILRSTPQDVKAMQGQVDVAKGRLEQIQAMIDELTIRASRDARVETLDLRPGDILLPNAIAAKLLEPDQLFVRIYVPETKLGLVSVGQKIPVSVDSFTGVWFSAVVEAISSQGEYTPRNLQTADERADQVFATRLRLTEGTDRLRAGMAATAKVER